MSTRPTGTIRRYLRNLVDAEIIRAFSDAQLLLQFTARHEEAAFTELVQRNRTSRADNVLYFLYQSSRLP